MIKFESANNKSGRKYITLPQIFCLKKVQSTCDFYTFKKKYRQQQTRAVLEKGAAQVGLEPVTHECVHRLYSNYMHMRTYWTFNLRKITNCRHLVQES